MISDIDELFEDEEDETKDFEADDSTIGMIDYHTSEKKEKKRDNQE